MNSASLVGLSPDQIAQQLAVEQGDERLRQQSIASIVSGYQGFPAMDLQQAQAENLGARTNTLRETTPGLSAAQQAITDYHNQQTAASKEQVALALKAGPGTVAHTQAQTEALRSQTKAQDLLGQLPAQRIQAEIDKLKDSRGTYTDLELPDGSKVRVTGSDLLAAQTAGAHRDQTIQAHNDALTKQRYELVRTQGLDAQKLLETGAEAQKFIENSANKNNPAVKGQINVFNASSNEPYIYHFDDEESRWAINPSRLWKDKPVGVQKIAIPPTLDAEGNRVQHNARWVAYQAALKTMSPEEFIRTLMLPHAVK